MNVSSRSDAHRLCGSYRWAGCHIVVVCQDVDTEQLHAGGQDAAGHLADYSNRNTIRYLPAVSTSVYLQISFLNSVSVVL